MRGAYAHAPEGELAQPDELLRDEANEVPVGVSLENAEALSCDAAEGILLGCVIGAFFWLLIAIFAVRVL
jgi:hypothetical protein